jgi:octaprenyl-diphosphate synthase
VGDGHGHLKALLEKKPASHPATSDVEALMQVQARVAADVQAHVSRLTSQMPEGARVAIEPLFEAGGKRLRPLVCALSARAAGARNDGAIEVASAVELIHTATLLHDDVIDEADTRRGAPTARVSFGNSLAVLAGDFAFFESLDLLIETGRLDIFSLWVRTARRIVEGELTQLRQRGLSHILTTDAYLDLAARKTGALFAFAAQAGAMAAGADEATSEALADYGHHLGVAFQIVDDILDVTGDPDEMGKGVASDLVQGHLTLPVLCAMKRKPELAHTVRTLALNLASGAPADMEAVTRVLDEARQAAGPEAALRVAEDQARQALQALDRLPASPWQCGLSTLMELALHRAT